jgi:hypothetical protein
LRLTSYLTASARSTVGICVPPCGPAACEDALRQVDQTRCGCSRIEDWADQQPGAIAPGVATAPVGLAGVIVPGVARFIVMPSAHADVFGVGTMVIVGSMLVPPNSVITGWIVPGGGFAGIAGVESGKAAPLVGGPPGIELHTVVEGLPSEGVGEMFPVVVRTIGVGMVPSVDPGVDNVVIVPVVPGMDEETVLGTVDDVGTGTAVIEGDGRGGTAGGCGAGMVVPGKSVMNDVAGCTDSGRIGAVVLPVVDEEELAGTADVVGAAETDGIVPIVPPIADIEVTATAGGPGAICPVGVEQVTTVPGVVGSEASGTGASVVSGAPGCVVAENGLGPLSGEVTIVPGVDGSPMAVVPMVETCARLLLQPSCRAAAMNNKRRIAMVASAPI